MITVCLKMPGILKVISALLICCIIAYSNAWAFEYHSDELVMSDEIVTNSNVHNGHESDQHESKVDCDHCCHAYAHMLAFCSHNSLTMIFSKAGNLSIYHQTSTSYIGNPAFKPPIV